MVFSSWTTLDAWFDRQGWRRPLHLCGVTLSRKTSGTLRKSSTTHNKPRRNTCAENSNSSSSLNLLRCVDKSHRSVRIATGNSQSWRPKSCTSIVIVTMKTKMEANRWATLKQKTTSMGQVQYLQQISCSTPISLNSSRLISQWLVGITLAAHQARLICYTTAH